MRADICEYLDWDSAFFGFRVARLAEGRLTADRAASAIDWCEANRIDCLYFLAPSADAETAAIAQSAAFQFVDIRVTLERCLPAEDGNTSAVRAFQVSDGDRLRSIASACHGDSRFYHDPRFPRSSCDLLYATWIERSFNGWADAVLVADSGGEPAGYISCHLSPSGVGSIGLVGVDREFQGRGLGGQLIDASLGYFHRNGMKQATVVTQGRNILSQRLFQRRGFLTRSVQLWYHRWFSSLRHDSLSHPI